MSDDVILGGILRRFLTDEDEYSSVSTGDLVLDGRIRLTDEESTAVDRALNPAPPRKIRLGDTFDLAPYEKAEVVTADGGLVFSIDGGLGGLQRARIG